MQLSDFDFDLPPELIARYPLPQRSSSRLLCVTKHQLSCEHRLFSDLPTLLQPGDLLVFNNSKVLKARVLGQKASGGQIEMLVERLLDKQHALVHIRASKSPKPDSLLCFGDYRLRVVGRQGRLYEVVLLGQADLLAMLEDLGQMPLPPYMDRQADETDLTRYQTVYAQALGSVAAPTAGLHFDEALMHALQAQGIDFAYVTLHVGAGTFLPIQTESIHEHEMHSEWLEVPQSTADKILATKARGGRVIAVGTTSVRSLESAALTQALQAYSGDTRLFIYPGFSFKVIDGMITNFHLPRSSLLLLVSALAGRETIMSAYQTAIAAAYRFYSYGDAMLILP